MYKFLLSFSILFSIGCATTPRPSPFSDLSVVDLTGVKPTNPIPEVERIANTKIKRTLLDPESMQISYSYDKGELSMVGCIDKRVTSTENMKLVKAWGSTIEINAKNKLGGYTGAKSYTVFFDNGLGLGYIGGSVNSNKADENPMLLKFCKGSNFSYKK